MCKTQSRRHKRVKILKKVAKTDKSKGQLKIINTKKFQINRIKPKPSINDKKMIFFSSILFQKGKQNIMSINKQ